VRCRAVGGRAGSYWAKPSAAPGATVGGMERVGAQRELRNQDAEVLAAVEAGVSFVVTRNGVPVA